MAFAYLVNIPTRISIMLKWILIICLFFYCDAAAQNKKELIDWLNSRFQNSPVMSYETGTKTRFLKIADDGSFTIRAYDYPPKIALPNEKNYTAGYRFMGHIKDLDPATVRTSTFRGNLFLFARCKTANCIVQESLGKQDYGEYQLNEVLLGVTSALNLEEKAKQTIIQLIKISNQ